MPKYPPTRVVNGRTLINRAEQAARTGLSARRLYSLYAERGETGHPEPVKYFGPTPYWDEKEWTRWHERYQEAKQARLTEVDTSGDPEEMVSAARAARILGYASGDVIHAYLRAHPGYFPEPDDAEELPSGRVRRRWRRATIWAFAASRDARGGGRPAAPTASVEVLRPTPGLRYAQHPLIEQARAAMREDPPPSVAAFATRVGIPEYTARRLLAAARDPR